ncbi:MAG: hypothetical protein MMC33_008212 [Icmadophila ericetorum]|nr:hypothetical protein [Icmadophila ericetorum]
MSSIKLCIILLNTLSCIIPSLAQSFVYPALSGPAVTFTNKDTVPIRWQSDYETISLLLHVDGQETYYQILDTQPNAQSYDFYVGDNLVNSQGISYHFELEGVDSSGNLVGSEYFDSGSFIVAAAGSSASTTAVTTDVITVTTTQQDTTTVSPPTTIQTSTSSTAAAEVSSSSSSTATTLQTSTSSVGIVVVTVTGTTPASTSVAVQKTSDASSKRSDSLKMALGLLVGCIGLSIL